MKMNPNLFDRPRLKRLARLLNSSPALSARSCHFCIADLDTRVREAGRCEGQALELYASTFRVQGSGFRVSGLGVWARQ